MEPRTTANMMKPSEAMPKAPITSGSPPLTPSPAASPRSRSASPRGRSHRSILMAPLPAPETLRGSLSNSPQSKTSASSSTDLTTVSYDELPSLSPETAASSISSGSTAVTPRHSPSQTSSPASRLPSVAGLGRRTHHRSKSAPASGHAASSSSQLDFGALIDRLGELCMTFHSCAAALRATIRRKTERRQASTQAFKPATWMDDRATAHQSPGELSAQIIERRISADQLQAITTQYFRPATSAPSPLRCRHVTSRIPKSTGRFKTSYAVAQDLVDASPQPPLPSTSTFPSPTKNAYGKWLVIETRLKDRGVLDTDAGFATIPHATQEHYLRSVLDIASKALWEFMYVNDPELVNKQWAEGAGMIKFGNEDLTKQGLGAAIAAKSNDIDKLRAHDLVKAQIDLRNAVCHPGNEYGPRQGGKMDTMMAKAQELLIVLHHYRGAMEIRHKRDGLQKHVIASSEEFNMTSKNQTQDTEWPLHHERLLHKALEDPKEYPGKIRKASIIWNRGGHPKSDGFPSSGQVVDGGGYIRCPGQDEDYFTRLHKPTWDADTPEFVEGLEASGASSTIAHMSAAARLREVEDRGPAWDTDSASAEALRESQIQQAIASATANGLFR